MELAELWDLVGWVQKYVVDAKTQKRYGGLHNVLSQNAQPNQAKQPIEEQAKSLTAALRAMPMQRLTTAQRTFLASIGMAEYIGPEGADRVEDVLYHNAIDVVTAATKVQQAAERVNKGIERINQLRTGLDGVVSPPEQDADAAIVRVTFAQDAAIDNVVALKKWSAAWHDVARGVAMAHDMPPEEVRVVGAQRGSVIIDLAVVFTVATTLGTIIEKGLAAALRIHEIRHEAERVRALKLANSKAEAELRHAARLERDRRIEEISQHVTKSLNLRANGDGDKINALDKSIKQLIDFLDKGGEVDMFVQGGAEQPPADAAGDNRAAGRLELRQKIEDIRALEDKLRRLEYKPDPADEAEPPPEG